MNRPEVMVPPGLLIRNGTLVYPDRMAKADILVEKGKIMRVEAAIALSELPRDTEIINASGLFVFPGFIDAHTHYGLGKGDDGTADGFFKGSRAAAFGGITSFIDFSDQIPCMSLAESAAIRISEAEDSTIDFALHQGIYRLHEKLPRELDELKEFGVTSVKLFTTYREFGVFFDPADWGGLFPLCRDRHIMLCIHAEDDELISEIGSRYSKKNLSPGMHPVLRPPAAEANAILKVGEAAAVHDAPLYIVHISSGAGLEALREVRKRGVRVVAETTPHYLFLDRNKLEGPEGAKFIMTPPLREAEDNAVLQHALEAGEIDIVATDHCSFKPEQKMNHRDCRDIPAGIPGSEEMSMMLFSHLSSGSRPELFPFINMGNLLSRNPAMYFGLYPEKGSLIPGTDADIVLFSASETGVISDSMIHSNAGYSVYNGYHYSGKPVMTILRGEIIVRELEFLGSKGGGRFLKCSDSAIYTDG